jgi:hypothetical protein
MSLATFTQPVLPGGFAVIDLLWQVVFLAPFILLLFHKEKLFRLFLIGVSAYVIGDIIYQLVRIMAFPHSSDHWMIMGPRVIAVAFLGKIAEERLIPHEKDRGGAEYTPMVVRVLYAGSFLFGLTLLAVSFIWGL